MEEIVDDVEEDYCPEEGFNPFSDPSMSRSTTPPPSIPFSFEDIPPADLPPHIHIENLYVPSSHTPHANPFGDENDFENDVPSPSREATSANSAKNTELSALSSNMDDLDSPASPENAPAPSPYTSGL